MKLVVFEATGAHLARNPRGVCTVGSAGRPTGLLP